MSSIVGKGQYCPGCTRTRSQHQFDDDDPELCRTCRGITAAKPSVTPSSDSKNAVRENVPCARNILEDRKIQKELDDLW